MNKTEEEKYKKFSCKICLDLANEPVITPCGHLYCWQCIYNWAQTKSPLKCPYCSNIFDLDKVTTIFTGDNKDNQNKQEIPKRPQNPRTNPPQQQPQQNNFQFGLGFGFPFMMFSTFNLNQQQGNYGKFMLIFFIGMFLMNFLSFSDSYESVQQTRHRQRRNTNENDYTFLICLLITGGFLGLTYLMRKLR